MVDQSILTCDFVRYTLQTTLIADTVNKQVYNDKPRKQSVIHLKGSYLEIQFVVIRPNDNGDFANNSCKK